VLVNRLKLADNTAGEKAMDKSLLAAGLVLAAFPSAVAAQGAPAAASCYVEVAKLMADPPTGIGDIGAAIREIDVKLRPQVEEVNALKAQIARIEQRQAEAAGEIAGGADDASFEDEGAALPPPVREDPDAEELQRLQAELQTKQDQLKLDYAAQQEALVGPVQERVSRGAQSFSATSGCPELKMVRTPDLAELTAAGARNVTGEFVAWYLSDRPG
jgi:Skp family chaperone for outer membrane proteins